MADISAGIAEPTMRSSWPADGGALHATRRTGSSPNLHQQEVGDDVWFGASAGRQLIAVLAQFCLAMARLCASPGPGARRKVRTLLSASRLLPRTVGCESSH